MVRSLVVLLSLLSFYANAFEVPLRPDPEVTTGDLCTPHDGDFEGFRYKENVPTCYRDVSRERKHEIYETYGVPQRCRKQYTVDHYIPLSLGGSNQPANLWPEHKDIKATRQNLEQSLYTQVRAGLVSQRQAVAVIVEAKNNPPHVDPRDCSAN